MSRPPFICDAQVHAPVVDPVGQVNGIDEAPLLSEMAIAKVDRAIIVPMATKTDPADNGPSLEIARRHPSRFRVMGLVDLERARGDRDLIAGWRDTPGMVGIRVSCVREPNRSMLLNDELEWLWEAAAANQVPVALFSPEMLNKVTQIAQRHPSLKIIADHLGLRPHVVYADLVEPVKGLLPLATCPNVAVKATSLPSSVTGPYPYRSAHEAIRMVVDTFGAARVFWGSDITRLPCTYSEAITMFTDELDFLTEQDLDLIMGRALCDWVAWPLT